jgi:hypothetical protein
MNKVHVFNNCDSSVLRPCYVTRREVTVGDKPHALKTTVRTDNALFHCWEQKSQVVAPSPMVGGHPGGTVSGVLGIVEFANGSIAEVEPTDIVFIDNKHEEYACFVEKETGDDTH